MAAVCHGPAAILNATLSDGSYLIKGKKVTGFSNEEEAITEILIGAKNVVPIFLKMNFQSAVQFLRRHMFMSL